MSTRVGRQAPPTLQELREHRDRILALADRRGARNVRVFGSVAAGRAHEASDVDILVALDSGRSVVDLAGFQLDLEDLLGCPVDVVTEGGVKSRLRARVLAAARPL
jgi:predicted nucleotidyltransferase